MSNLLNELVAKFDDMPEETEFHLSFQWHIKSGFGKAESVRKRGNFDQVHKDISAQISINFLVELYLIAKSRRGIPVSSIFIKVGLSCDPGLKIESEILKLEKTLGASLYLARNLDVSFGISILSPAESTSRVVAEENIEIRNLFFIWNVNKGSLVKEAGSWVDRLTVKIWERYINNLEEDASQLTVDMAEQRKLSREDVSEFIKELSECLRELEKNIVEHSGEQTDSGSGVISIEFVGDLTLGPSLKVRALDCGKESISGTYLANTIKKNKTLELEDDFPKKKEIILALREDQNFLDRERRAADESKNKKSTGLLLKNLCEINQETLKQQTFGSFRHFGLLILGNFVRQYNRASVTAYSRDQQGIYDEWLQPGNGALASFQHSNNCGTRIVVNIPIKSVVGARQRLVVDPNLTRISHNAKKKTVGSV